MLALTVSMLAVGCAGAPGTPGAPQPGAQDASATGSASPAAAAPVASQPPLHTAMVPAPSLQGNLVSEPTEQEIQVSLPAGYEQGSKRYPVMYYLPGFGDTHKVFDGGNPGPMILVGINGISKLGGSFYANSPVTGRWEDFVTRDVVSYVDATYRTIAAPEGRAIAGHSMGGFGVLNAAMHTATYAYAYAMSPGVFAPGGMAGFALDFGVLRAFASEVSDLSDDEAHREYLSRTAAASWPSNLSFSYAAAFAPDPGGKAPYALIPAETGGKDAHDAAWRTYEAGYGDIEAKLDRYAQNLEKLKGFVIEYGTNDEFGFIPEGCDYLSQQLAKRGIDHELVTYDGRHQDKLPARITDVLLPYLAGEFGT